LKRLTICNFSGFEVKLYPSTKDTRWFAFGARIGWMMFPAEVGGWQKRQHTNGPDLSEMREIPLCRGFNTGIPGAPSSSVPFLLPKRQVKVSVAHGGDALKRRAAQ
jgi:hypothetical protein